MEQARHVLVLTGPSGRTLSVGAVPSGGYVLDDLDKGHRLGQVGGDLNPFLLDGEGASIVFAGPAEGSMSRVVIRMAGQGEEVCPVKGGVWMSFPRPFVPGMRILAVWQDKDGHELFRRESPPLHPDSLEPIFGPGWTAYAPLGDDREGALGSNPASNDHDDVPPDGN